MNNKYFFFTHKKYNGSFSMLTYTLFSCVKVNVNGSSFTDIYMKFRNAYMLNNRTPVISAAHLLKSRDLSECCLQKFMTSFSLMCSVLHLTQLLLAAGGDTADPSALVVVADTCILKMCWIYTYFRFTCQLLNNTHCWFNFLD